MEERQEIEQETPSPTKSEIHCSNRYLTMEEMQVNTKYIYNYLIAQGWTKNAISVLLGNMQKESYINPGLWENKKENNMKGGFGLVQWMPATKFIDWAKKNSLDYKDIDAQLQRILSEVQITYRGDPCWQWKEEKHSSNMSFEKFTKSNLDPKKLAEIFLMCYERPTVKDQKEINERSENAANWHKFLNSSNNSKCFQNFQYMI